MGKKKNKNTGFNGEGMYNQERNNMVADHLEDYLDAIQNLFILEGRKESEVKDAIKTVKKAIKNLREGRPEKVYDEERFDELFEDEKW